MSISRKRFNQLDQGLRLVPKFLLETSVPCSACGCNFSPRWLDKIMPPRTQGTVSNQIIAVLKCPACGSEVEFPLPSVEQKACYGFFGDEAFRDVGDKFVLTYSLVGTNRQRLPEIEDRIKAFKKKVAPTVDPDDWSIHMKEIWPPDAQRKHPLFGTLSREAIDSFCADLFALVRSFDEAFLIYNVSAVIYKHHHNKRLKKEKEEIRHDAYTTLLFEIIDNATRYGVAPFFTFDSEKDSAGDKIIHQWAKDAFEGGQLNLAYHYLSRGIRIEEPTFVKPASRPCLELADFVSYVIARYLHRRLTDRPVDLDPVNLGQVTYLCFDGKGDLRRAYGKGFPWEKVYGSAN